MNANYFVSPHFYFDVVIGIGFVLLMVLLVALIRDLAGNNGSRK